MSDQRTIGYTIDYWQHVCKSCGYANKDAQHIEPAYNTEHPNGFFCGECYEQVTP